MRCQSFLIAVVILVAEGCVSGQSMHAPEYNSVQQGVYSATQAARGEAVWNNHCAECHYPEEYSNGYLYAWSGENVFDLYARGEAVWNNHCAECHYPEEYSNGYLYAWSGENVFDLYAYLRITMPYLAPGTLEDEQYVDVTAFLLSQNLLPAGDAELAVDRESLQGILIEGPF